MRPSRFGPVAMDFTSRHVAVALRQPREGAFNHGCIRRSVLGSIVHAIKLRHDSGSQYHSRHFQSSPTWLSTEDDAAVIGEPRATGWPDGSSGPKEQRLWAKLFEGVNDLRLLDGYPPFSQLSSALL
jgi:hypothetical protein